MPKPSWPLQPWARPCPETALSPAAGTWPCVRPAVPQPWGTPATCRLRPLPSLGEGQTADSTGAQGCLTQGPRVCRGSPAALSCPGRVKPQLAAQVSAPAAVVPCPQAPRGQFLPVPACRSLPLPEFGEKGEGGNRTGSMAVAMPVSVIYIVYKSIKQSILLSAILPGGLVLLQERTAGDWQGVQGREGQWPPPNRQPSTNQDPF